MDTTGKYLYSIAAGAGATISENYIHDPQKVSFSMDQVDGVSVIRAFGTGNVLVAKYSDAKAAWRIWCLPEEELANEGVFPVMLANLHVHTFDSAFEHDENGHWKTCACGSASAPESHDYVMDETLGYGVCRCGADQKPHECASTDGKWYASDTQHYQLCGQCGEAINKAEHTYGAWSFYTEAGYQTRSCTLCGNVQTLHGTDSKVSQVTKPVAGQSYCLVANVNGQLLSKV